MHCHRRTIAASIMVLGLFLAWGIRADADFVGPNLVVNGGFELPTPLPYYYGEDLSAGSTAIPGWTIVSGSVTLSPSSFYQAYEGNQSLDLDGFNPGAISQAFATVVGAQYQLSFHYANNTPTGTLSTETANVDVTGSGGSSLFSAKISHSNSTPTSPQYTLFVGNFSANSTTTTLTFTSTDPSSSNTGVVFDAVSVNAVPEPASLALMGIGVVVMVVRYARCRRVQE